MKYTQTRPIAESLYYTRTVHDRRIIYEYKRGNLREYERRYLCVPGRSQTFIPGGPSGRQGGGKQNFQNILI